MELAANGLIRLDRNLLLIALVQRSYQLNDSPAVSWLPMRTSTMIPAAPSSPDQCPAATDDLSSGSRASWHRSASLLYSRRAHRIPFDGELEARGLDDDLQPVTGSEFTAMARDISADGISFRHEGPLPYRFVELSYSTPRGPVTRRVRLTWCRYSARGYSISGGRFLPDGTRSSAN